ncbi:hypothetical protein UFOVP703_38 [uncultured Caudovirales phage]|uniref:Uncharacterized protein n=1 Tax=uncultured Caudovirales phage TaxID=2100421 RepID=A0A6J5NHW9_9CAUD|nr:hypothetical protein UFOVP703_38 [uncultured Caudovirales phage]
MAMTTNTGAGAPSSPSAGYSIHQLVRTRGWAVYRADGSVLCRTLHRRDAVAVVEELGGDGAAALIEHRAGLQRMAAARLALAARYAAASASFDLRRIGVLS